QTVHQPRRGLTRRPRPVGGDVLAPAARARQSRAMRSLDIGIAFDLRSNFTPSPNDPDDALEEYDTRATIDALLEALRQLGHRPRPLAGGRALIEALLSAPPEIVFNIAEGRGGRSREAHAPAVCEMLGIPYTHSDPVAMSVTLDKALTKQLVQ